MRPLTDTFAGLNGRGAKPADATLTALGCPLPEPSQAKQFMFVRSYRRVSADKRTSVRLSAQNAGRVHHGIC